MSESHSFHLAQFNIARLKFPLEHPSIAEFVNNLDAINSLAESSSGFVWRLQDDSGDATSISIYDDPKIIVNMSVWESVKQLKEFVYFSQHKEFLKRRNNWFSPIESSHHVMWWLPKTDLPTAQQGKQKLEYLNSDGESDKGFSFRKSWPAPDQK